MPNFFKQKSIAPSKRVCLRLKEERERLGVTLKELSDKTKISTKHLIALEDCQFKELPEAIVYQKNFVKKYVEALKIDPTPFLDQFQIEEVTRKKIKHPHRIIKQNLLSHLPLILRFVLVGVFILFLIGYLAWQIKNIIEPPRLLVFSPLDGTIVNTQSIEIQGETDKEVSVNINGKNITVGENGQFKETIDLNVGVNTITISALKKHGKTTTETRNVVYRENPKP